MEKRPAGTIYISGKKQSHARPSKVSLVKAFALLFQNSISTRLDALLAFDSEVLKDHGIPDKVAVFVINAQGCIEMIFNIKNGITRSCKERVVELKGAHDQLSDFVLSHQTQIAHSDSRVLGELNLLLKSCMLFIHQFEQTCTLVWDLASMPNRPVDRELKGKFLRAIIEYQKKNDTDRFPRHSLICDLIDVSPLRFSERRYRDWKSQLLNHTFHLNRQPKGYKSGNK